MNEKELIEKIENSNDKVWLVNSLAEYEDEQQRKSDRLNFVINELKLLKKERIDLEDYLYQLAPIDRIIKSRIADLVIMEVGANESE